MIGRQNERSSVATSNEMGELRSRRRKSQFDSSCLRLKGSAREREKDELDARDAYEGREGVQRAARDGDSCDPARQPARTGMS